MTCRVRGCKNDIRARKLCGKHYARWWKHGDPSVCITKVKIPWQERFLAKIDKTSDAHGCWIWTGSKDDDGYGKFTPTLPPSRKRIPGYSSLAHRISYELHTGKSLGGKQIDHTCFNHSCVNPSHLRPATNKQNHENRRGARRDSQSGVLGVSPKRGRWVAQVQHNGKKLHIGYFDFIEDAAEAVRLKRIELFTFNDMDRDHVTI